MTKNKSEVGYANLICFLLAFLLGFAEDKFGNEFTTTH